MARLVKMNWDDECRQDIKFGRGFRVYESDLSKENKKEKKNMHGIHSPLFATDWDDANAFEERYRCSCGALQGLVFNNELCDVCKTEVKFKDVDLSIFGWIILDSYSIIHPVYYKKLTSLIGGKIFQEIIMDNTTIDANGHEIKKDSSTNNPFFGIGIDEFKDRYMEIVLYYKKKKKAKKELVKELLMEQRNVFTKCIPVYSSVLRPLSFKSDSRFTSPIDKIYNPIVNLVNSLNGLDNKSKSLIKGKRKKKTNTMSVQQKLQGIQKRVMELWDNVFSQIHQKDGLIRDQILGGRINYVARNVIIPDACLKANEIKVCYLTFLELFKYEIIPIISKMNNIPESQAHEVWIKATINFDAMVYEVMRYLLTKKPRVLINRNPTINYGSMLCMKIVDIKAEYKEDYTMSLPIPVLSELNADFDGDTLTIISLKTEKLIKKFKAMDPKLNMFVSKNDGKFNPKLGLLKDQIIGLREFSNI